MTRAAAYFAAQGVSRIGRVITDNHFGYRRSTQVATAVAQLGATHKFIKPHCPWQNGPANRGGLPPGLRLRHRAGLRPC
ncbi:DDE-type integrase/transposase/recombinase [Mycobacterium paraense]|nr:DDE-type integrase/transposase/recombinase [Mycobacterium paraense]